MIRKIALTMIPGLGCRSLRQLLDTGTTPEDIYSMSHADLAQLFGRHESIAKAIENKSTFRQAEEELVFMEQHHIRPLFCTDHDYPQRLNREGCEDTPALLYVMGSANLNASRVVSIVGTRHATDSGREMTLQLVNGLKNEGVLVVSGLAYGIDTAAHTAALSNALPTVGVLGHGLDQLYPPQNRKLAKEMVQHNGALVTEYPSKTPCIPSFFPARNRIIAAMSDAVVVVEAGSKGGALITANLANGYHRDVLAFPGRVGDTYSEGTNRIIANNKALLITNCDDLFNALNWQRNSLPDAPRQQVMPIDLNDDETILYNLLTQNQELLMEEMVALCNLSMPKIAAALLSLELKNICRCLPGKRYKLY